MMKTAALFIAIAYRLAVAQPADDSKPAASNVPGFRHCACSALMQFLVA